MSMLLIGTMAFANQESIKLPDTLLPVQAQMSSKIITFAPVAAKNGNRVILKARFFYQNPAGSGWNSASNLALNTRILRPMTADGKFRLLRRGASAEFADKSTRDWWDKRNGLLIFYSSDLGVLDKRVAQTTAAESTWYYLDITDSVTDKKENTLKITNGMRAVGPAAAKLAETTLVCKDMEVFYMPEAEADKLRPAVTAERP